MRLEYGLMLAMGVGLVGCPSDDEAGDAASEGSSSATGQGTGTGNTAGQTNTGGGPGTMSGGGSTGLTGATGSTGTAGTDGPTGDGSSSTGGGGGLGDPCMGDEDCTDLPCNPLGFCAENCSPAGECVPGPPEELCFVPGDVAGACVPTCAPPDQGEQCGPCPLDWVCVWGDTGLNLFPAVGPSFVCVPPMWTNLFDTTMCPP